MNSEASTETTPVTESAPVGDAAGKLQTRLALIERQIADGGQAVARETDAWVRENPWAAAGFGLGAGLLLGLLIGRR